MLFLCDLLTVYIILFCQNTSQNLGDIGVTSIIFFNELKKPSETLFVVVTLK